MNKRIQKKRDRHRLILSVLRFAHTYEHETLPHLREMKRIMGKMTMPELHLLKLRIAEQWIFHHSPFRSMRPYRQGGER